MPRPLLVQFCASLVILLSMLSFACTDPNTQVNDARSAERTHADDSRLGR
jgi:hypothetical protein